MAKRKQSMDENKIRRYINEGRGSGCEEKYIPITHVKNIIRVYKSYYLIDNPLILKLNLNKMPKTKSYMLS